MQPYITGNITGNNGCNYPDQCFIVVVLPKITVITVKVITLVMHLVGKVITT